MSQDAWPFASRVAYEAEWREMGRLWSPSGVMREAGEGVVTQRAAGANLSVDVATLNAWIVGHYFESDAIENVAVPAPAANPRIDTIVVELDFVANTRTIKRHAGAEGAVPAAPALTQNRTTKYELPLFDIYNRVGQVSVKTTDDATNGYVSTDRRSRITPGLGVDFKQYAWGIGGVLVVPSGAAGPIAPVTVEVPTGWAADLVACRRFIRGGTSATIKIQRGTWAGAMTDLGGSWSSLSATTTPQEIAPTAVALAHRDRLAPVITAVSASPDLLSVDLLVRYTPPAS